MAPGLRQFSAGSWGIVAVWIVAVAVPGCRHSRDLDVEIEIVNRVQAAAEEVRPDQHRNESLLETSPDPNAGSLPSPIESRESKAGNGLEADRVFTLEEAVAEAFQRQPRLKSQLELIEQSRQGENVAFAPFLPLVSTGYTVGSYGVQVGGIGIPVPGGGQFNFVPGVGTIPIGFNFNTGFELTEFRVQWLVTDFGKRLGRYRQAGIATEMVQLQTSRAHQTIAHEVTTAYFQLLRSKALRRIADASVERCQEEVEHSEKLAAGGALERENVLRAKVQLATAQKLQDSAQAGEQIAEAALNLAMGRRVNDPIRVENPGELPAFNQSLAQCLETAVAQRREFSVAKRSIDSAQEGKSIARADFAPKVIADGFYLDYHQNKPGGFVDIPIGSIKLEWALFEGGKRVAELRSADSRIRSSMAQAESLSDSIAYQVNEAYRLLIVSRRAIERSRAPVEQTQETYRIVKARARAGDANPSEIIEAETALTRADQEYQTALFDYLLGLSKLEYAMGITADSTSTLGKRGHGGPVGNPGKEGNQETDRNPGARQKRLAPNPDPAPENQTEGRT